MQDIQAIFSRIQEAKKKQKDLKSSYQEALKTAPEYQDILDKMKVFRERKKQIEQTVKEQFSNEFITLDDLKIDIASDTELVSDMALSRAMKGESVQVTDSYNNTYEPLFVVKFKKVT